MADEKSRYAKYDQRTNKKMAEHNREGGDVRKPVRTVEGASDKDKRDRARFAFRKASQALTASHPLKDEQGRPTPAAMQFKRWGFKVPQNREDLQRLKAFGEKHMKKPEDVAKSWADATDNKPTGQWSVKPFRTMRPERGVEHAHISAPGNRGAIMSFKHNKKTGHTEILNFRAYTFHNDAFNAGAEAMRQGVPMKDVDNIMEFHRSNVGVIGPAGVRAAARYLKEQVGSKTVGGLRVSGSRVNNENDLPKAPTRREGNLESLPGVQVKRELGKAIDYDALDEQYDPRPKKAGKGGKGSPVGSRADQQRHQQPAFDATRNRIAELKPEGVSAAEWQSGVKHESEHGNVAPSEVDQAKIAAVHLKEEPHYYSKLKRAGIK